MRQIGFDFQVHRLTNRDENQRIGKQQRSENQGMFDESRDREERQSEQEVGKA